MCISFRFVLSQCDSSVLTEEVTYWAHTLEKGVSPFHTLLSPTQAITLLVSSALVPGRKEVDLE